MALQNNQVLCLMKLKKIFTVGLMLLMFSTSALAFDIPEPNGYVTDTTGTLSYEDEMSLEFKIDRTTLSTHIELDVRPDKE